MKAHRRRLVTPRIAPVHTPKAKRETSWYISVRRLDADEIAGFRAHIDMVRSGLHPHGRKVPL